MTDSGYRPRRRDQNLIADDAVQDALSDPGHPGGLLYQLAGIGRTARATTRRPPHPISPLMSAEPMDITFAQLEAILLRRRDRRLLSLFYAGQFNFSTFEATIIP